MQRFATIDHDDGQLDAVSDIDERIARLALVAKRLLETEAGFVAALNDFVVASATYTQTHKSGNGAQVKSRPRPAVGDPPALSIMCFGRFEVYRARERITPCHNRNGQTILRYLAAQPHHREHGDVLMDVLWPDDTQEVARHKLHCAVSALRSSLTAGKCPQKGTGYLVNEEGTYGLGNQASVEIDADKLLAGYVAGQQLGGEAAIQQYQSACGLYSGPFLPDDLYAEWSHIRRQQLTQAYLSMCSSLADHMQATGKLDAAADWALRILQENRCDENAHRQLMLAYAAKGQRSEAIRQFRRCECVLSEELGVRPMAETQWLFESIVRGDALPDSAISH